MLTIYEHRLAHVTRIGLPTLGFAEAVDRLRATPHKTLRLAATESTEAQPDCIVFLAPDQMEAVAAVAILGPPVDL